LIVAERKPVDEIVSSIAKAKKVLIAACGTCVTVCMAGGEKEAAELASLLTLKSGGEATFEVIVPKRQCDDEFLDEYEQKIREADLVLSMGCGVGVQFIADKFRGVRVIPALNTKFMGATKDLGVWSELCQGCGNCILEKTGGICPVTRCSKSNFNGPCGGSSRGKCEIDSEVDCAWQLIYDRLKELGQLDRLYDIIEPKDWRSSRDGGPRKIVRTDMTV
jgi:ferredoxin